MCYHQIHADINVPTKPELLKKFFTRREMEEIRTSVGRQELERIASVTHDTQNPDYDMLAEEEGRDLAILHRAINEVFGYDRPWIMGFASDFARGLLTCTQ